MKITPFLIPNTIIALLYIAYGFVAQKMSLPQLPSLFIIALGAYIYWIYNTYNNHEHKNKRKQIEFNSILMLLITPVLKLLSTGVFVWSIICFLGGPDADFGNTIGIAFGFGSLLLSYMIYYLTMTITNRRIKITNQ